MPLDFARLPMPPQPLKWVGKSSFLVFRNLNGYRVDIEPSGRLKVPKVRSNEIDFRLSAGEILGDFHSLEFSPRMHSLYLIHGELLDSRPVSLWDYQGNQLWSSEPQTVEWASFQHHSSRIVIARWPELSEKAPDHEFEILDLDPNGKPLPPSKVVPAPRIRLHAP